MKTKHIVIGLGVAAAVVAAIVIPLLVWAVNFFLELSDILSRG